MKKKNGWKPSLKSFDAVWNAMVAQAQEVDRLREERDLARDELVEYLKERFPEITLEQIAKARGWRGFPA